MKEKIERILSIDYGRKRIGIAVTDPLNLFAIPLVTIENDKNFWNNFSDLISNYTLSSIILGYPVKEDGTKSEITFKVEKFKIELEKKISCPVLFCDERYSSKIAKSKIIESVTSRKKRRNKALVDMNAAAVILEDYLKEF